MRRLAWIALTLVVLVVTDYVWSRRSEQPQSTMSKRPVVVPELSETARIGARTFAVHCSGCHGPDAGGTSVGPPLVDPIYRPRHHADVSFELAVRRGVVAHHWRFGDMPPIPALRADELAGIVRYVRELQRANGVE